MQMLELLDKDIKRVIITAFHVFKRPEGMLNILSRDIKIYLKINQTSRD